MFHIGLCFDVSYNQMVGLYDNFIAVPCVTFSVLGFEPFRCKSKEFYSFPSIDLPCTLNTCVMRIFWFIAFHYYYQIMPLWNSFVLFIYITHVFINFRHKSVMTSLYAESSASCVLIIHVREYIYGCISPVVLICFLSDVILHKRYKLLFSVGHIIVLVWLRHWLNATVGTFHIVAWCQ